VNEFSDNSYLSPMSDKKSPKAVSHLLYNIIKVSVSPQAKGAKVKKEA